MLKKFTLRNYKNFKNEISIDFENIAGYQFNMDCLYEGTIGKMLIYGRNATGKTNLGNALLDIVATMFGRRRYTRNEVFLNADSTENVATFSYEFEFNGTDVSYKYSRVSDEKLQDEALFVNGIRIFFCDFSKENYNFDNLNYIEAETINVERYLQSSGIDDDIEISNTKIPFLRWLLSNAVFKNNSVLISLSNYVERMQMITVGSGMRFLAGRLNQFFYELLEKRALLTDLEEFLNVMGIECSLALKELPDGQKELYFVHKQMVPFYENASSGTLALFDLYRRLIVKIGGSSFVYLDEFDAFYHYEMAEKVIGFFKRKYPKCQMIMTSHNTNLMTNRIMRPDCLLILSSRGTLTSLCNATERELREGHNLEKMYISGEFERYE